LTQSLLLKILKQKKNTPNLELYHHFIKSIPILTPKTETDPILEPSFKKINQTFFQNEMEQPNLIWGQPSFRKLASYNFHNDTITISTFFKDARPEVLNFLMYHEMLHKHHKFHVKNNRSSFHSPQFKHAEKQYPQHQEIEKEINRIIKTKKRSQKLPFFDLFR
jgi:predicted metal-dependent hydrolase